MGAAEWGADAWRRWSWAVAQGQSRQSRPLECRREGRAQGPGTCKGQAAALACQDGDVDLPARPACRWRHSACSSAHSPRASACSSSDFHPWPDMPRRRTPPPPSSEPPSCLRRPAHKSVCRASQSLPPRRAHPSPQVAAGSSRLCQWQASSRAWSSRASGGAGSGGSGPGPGRDLGRRRARPGHGRCAVSGRRRACPTAPRRRRGRRSSCCQGAF